MTFTADQLKAEELRLRYAELLRDPSVYPTKANWDYIIDNAMEGLGDMLLAKYEDAVKVDDVDRADLHTVAVEEFPRYLMAVSRPYAVKVVYGRVSSVTADLVRRCGLFDAPSICRLIEDGDTDTALDIIDVYQPEYSGADLAPMVRLAALIDNLPFKGRVEDRKGIFGVTTKYICPAGHVNDSDVEYCSSCGRDIRGITRDQAAAIDIYKGRVEALRSLLNH